jgi:isoleucyl-tRNA synthetase
LINRIQQIRRELGFDVTDRITVAWSSKSSRVPTAFEKHADEISREVLAVEVVRDDQVGGATLEIEGESVMIAVARSAV